MSPGHQASDSRGATSRMKGQDRVRGGQPLAEPATAAGALCFSGRQPRQLGPGSHRQLRLAGKLDSRVFRKALDGYQSVRQSETHSHHHRLQQAPRPCAGCSSSTSSATSCSTTPGSGHGPQFGELAARQFSNQMNSRQSSPGVHRTAETYQAGTVTPASRRPQSRQEQQCPQTRHRGARADYASPRHLQKFDKLGQLGMPGPCQGSSPGPLSTPSGEASSMPMAETCP